MLLQLFLLYFYFIIEKKNVFNILNSFDRKFMYLLTIGPSLAASLEPLAHPQNVASLSLFYRCYFGSCSYELAHLIPLRYSRGRYTHYSATFFVTIPRYYKDVYVNSFFSHTAICWNSLPIECFPLTYDLNGFKSRINIHLLTLGCFL